MADYDQRDDNWVPEMLNALLGAYTSLVATLSLSAIGNGAKPAAVHASLVRLVNMIDAAMPSDRTRELMHEQLDFLVETYRLASLGAVPPK